MQMLLRNTLLFFFVLFFTSGFVFAQDTSVQKDSTDLYKNIELYSKRNRFISSVYRLIFKPAAPVLKSKEIKAQNVNKIIIKRYSAFEGKIIRNIEVTSLDPFGFSVSDTSSRNPNALSRAANSLHIKTNGITIRNLMLVHKNQKFNSLLVRESERLIRSQAYVHDVSFYVVSAGQNSDSVDIFVRELDKWSLIPTGSISTTKIKAELTDKNFLGLGHGFQNDYVRNFTTNINSYYTFYSIPNIRNTFVNAKIHFGVDGYGNRVKSLTVDRPFYSPVTKWAAGVSLASQSKKDSTDIEIPPYVPINLRYNSHDFWAGKAIRISERSSDNEIVTNLIFTARFYNLHFTQKPSELIDPLHIYSDERFYLAGMGISSRLYVQDKYVFKFGIIEDVPVGKVIELTGGYQVRNNIGRPYLGFRLSSGKYNRFGYLSTEIGYGTFFNSSHTEQGVFAAGVNYYTSLMEIGRWKLRQFAKTQITVGINRFTYDTLTINDGYGLDGFNSPFLSGSKRIILTFQTQSYAPWNVLGFHFGPFLTCSFGMVGDHASGFKESKIYSQIGVGVLVKNFNLVIKTFQISVSFFPSIPGIGNNIFKVNSFRTTDFGFRDFEIGKPVPVTLR
jgi:hypothetical protein